MKSWPHKQIWADRTGGQARTQETKSSFCRYLNSFCVSFFLATFALGAAAHDVGAGTLNVNGFAIDAPKGCEINVNSKIQKGCNVLRQNGTELTVSLIVSKTNLDVTKEERTEFEQALEFLLQFMAEEHAETWESETNRVKLSYVDLPASRTPRGMTRCSSVTTKATKDGINFEERALLCYVYDPKKNTFFQVTGSVQDHYIPSDGQSASPDFGKQAARILATLRAR